MSTLTEHLVTLADVFGAHANISHWAVSMRVTSHGSRTGNGDLIDRLRNGADVWTATYEELMRQFSAIWPSDLEWPPAIPRPTPSKDAA